MNEVLAVILSLSLSGGIVIIMLYLVLLLFGKKLCRQWQYYIWMIAVIRLLLPFAPQQNLMNELFQSAEPSISGIDNSSMEDVKINVIHLKNAEDEINDIQSSEINVAITDETVDEVFNKELTGKQYVLSDIVRQYLWLIWLLPAIILFARKIITYEKNLQYIRAGSKEVQDIVLLEEFDKLLEKNHVKSRMTLSVNSMISSPILIGLFNPCIILSTTQMTVLEFQHTISHELVHYRRRDILYKWIIQIVVCIHWFNPLLYMMERSINRACELSCDEAVIWDLDKQERYAYGDTLLRAAGRNVKCKLPVSPIGFSDSRIKLKERLDAIMNFKKRSKVTYITMFSLAIILFVCSSYVGVYAATDPSKTKTSTSNSAQTPHSAVYKPGCGVTFGAGPDAYVNFDSYFDNKEFSSKIKKEYTKWNITIKNGVYYYKNKRIRILMDTRKDNSFKNFSYDKKGKVDIKVIRNSNNKITKVKYLSKKKAQEILGDLK